jgi:ADP-heptose:LPS heptosyltransferase
VSFFQIGNDNGTQKPLPVFSPVTTTRQIMALIWASDVYIGFDSGTSHIATALEVPALVLWDAVRKVELEEDKNRGFSTAMMSRWAYPQNKNLMLLGERRGEIMEQFND